LIYLYVTALRDVFIQTCIKVLEEGSDVGAIRDSHTSKSTFKMISVDP